MFFMVPLRDMFAVVVDNLFTKFVGSHLEILSFSFSFLLGCSGLNGA